MMKEGSKKELSCFIIMPFSEAKVGEKKLNKSQLEYIYKSYFCKAVKGFQNENFSFSNVSRYEGRRGNFVKGIVGNLHSADLVIADLSGLNPNVFYELGIRHTLQNGTILLTQDIISLPSDLQNYIAFEYKYPDPSEVETYYSEFENQLHKYINEFLKDPNHSDNPVKDFLQVKNIIKDEQRIKDILINIRLIKIVKQRYRDHIDCVKNCLSSLEKNEEKPMPYTNLGIDPILNRMVNLNESDHLIIFLQELITYQHINNNNIHLIKARIEDGRQVESIKDIPYGFKDLNEKGYHMLTILNYSQSNSNQYISDIDPINKSFDEIISGWEKEINDLER